MVRLYTKGSVHRDWTTAAIPFLEGFANSIIAIFDPNSENDSTNFDPRLNTTSAPVTELWRGEGQLAVFRQTLNADAPVGSVTQIRSVRFTVDLDGPQMPVRKGLIVRVIECEHDPAAQAFEYTVTSGINSGLAWRRTIEAESDMSVIVGPITGVT
jgi:hypothetical protein